MEVKDLPLDIISNLPPNIIQTILTFMPMRDSLRTSVLSHNWKNHCSNIPKLRFDDALFKGSAYENLSIKCKLLHVVYPIFFRHQGPILELYLCMSQLISCCEIDQIILHLSKNPTLKKFILTIASGDDHKLLPAFFKLQQLTDLALQNCVFQPPVAFNGFSRLARLTLNNVSMTAEVFLRFISNCPLLKDFTLIGYEKHFMGSWNIDFIELFKCLPFIEQLSLSWYPMKCFATGVMPQKLPIAPVHLRYLHLREVSFLRSIYLLSTLLLVTSSPNIERIIVEMQYFLTDFKSQTATNLIDQDYSYVILNNLREIIITNFTYMKSGMDFVKFILAKSPLLKKVLIRKHFGVDINGEVKMLKEMIQYPRASAKAEIMIT